MKLTKVKVIYKLEKGRLNSKLDREIEKFFKSYGLEFDGSGFDFTTEERDLYFYSKRKGGVE